MTAGRFLYRFDPRTASFTGYDIGGDLPEGLSCCGVQAIHSDGAGVLGWEPLAAWFDLTLPPAPASATAMIVLIPRMSRLTGSLALLRTRPENCGWQILAGSAASIPKLGHSVATGTGLLAGCKHLLIRLTYQPTAYIGPSGMVLLGTQQGLKLFEPGSGTLRVLSHDPADPHSLSGNEVWSIRSDREGNLWVGVKGGGVNRFSLHALRFGAWRSDSGDREYSE